MTFEDSRLVDGVSLDPGAYMGTDECNAWLGIPCDGRASKLDKSRNSRT